MRSAKEARRPTSKHGPKRRNRQHDRSARNQQAKAAEREYGARWWHELADKRPYLDELGEELVAAERAR